MRCRHRAGRRHRGCLRATGEHGPSLPLLGGLGRLQGAREASRAVRADARRARAGRGAAAAEARRRTLDPGPGVRSRLRAGLPSRRCSAGRAAGAFNELCFRRARPAHGVLQSLDAFFYPLDSLADWNRLYGRAGFLQYQFVVPFGREASRHEIVRPLGWDASCAVLAVMKRFGAESGCSRSRCRAGRSRSTCRCRLRGSGAPRPRRRARRGRGRPGVPGQGRTTAAPSALAAMYPRLSAWRETQTRLDPAGLMQGDLARRLRVTGRRGP